MTPHIHKESHRSDRIGWLRAAVLGANDGTISVASLVVGVAASGAPQSSVLLTGVAGLVAGAMSMAAGEGGDRRIRWWRVYCQGCSASFLLGSTCNGAHCWHWQALRHGTIGDVAQNMTSTPMLLPTSNPEASSFPVVCCGISERVEQ